jgi:lipopolysaccharide/colanic/teichoic acid biosynthesis glycosyltransferase
LFTPLVLVAGVAIHIIDPGPVFFWQPREGLAGKTVRILKLRTMYRDAERRLETLLANDPAIQAEWSTHFKLKHDPRILPVIGHLLRSTSLDELPQLFNVIVGEMGIVGPRPFPEYHLLAMNAEFRHKRRSVTPGLTGLWQISERSDADLDLQRQLDEFYIDNRSLWFDWHILLSTIPAVFRRGGAY